MGSGSCFVQDSRIYSEASKSHFYDWCDLGVGSVLSSLVGDGKILILIENVFTRPRPHRLKPSNKPGLSASVACNINI